MARRATVPVVRPKALLAKVPPAGRLMPLLADYTPAEAGDVIRQVVKAYTGKTITSGSPLDRWVTALDVAKLTPTKDPWPIHGTKLTRVDLFDLREALRLAWSLGVLHAPRHKVTISPSAIDELLLPDNASAPAASRMPSGVSLLYQAARLLQAAGGEMTVFGRESKGRDLLWKKNGGTASIERKDRAFAQTADTSKVQDFLKNKLVEASDGLTSHGGARIVSIGHATTTIAEARELRDSFKARLKGLLKGIPVSAWPHAAYCCFVGYEEVNGYQEAADFGDFVHIDRKGFRTPPAYVKVRPGFVKAYSIKSKKPL